MRSHNCFYPALVRELTHTASEVPGLEWMVKAALALNSDTERDCPKGRLWEMSVGWAASQCLKASFVLEVGDLPDEAHTVVHHLLLQLDLNRSVQIAPWCDPKRAFEVAAFHGFPLASTRLAAGENAHPFPMGVLPQLLCRGGVTSPLEQVLAIGETACKLVLGIHEYRATFSPEEQAILLSSVPLFGSERRQNRERIWQVLEAPASSVGRVAKVMALVKLASWFALADEGEIKRSDKQRLEELHTGDPGLQRLVALVPQCVNDEVLAA